MRDRRLKTCGYGRADHAAHVGAGFQPAHQLSLAMRDRRLKTCGYVVE
jgi:hypothetical protein